MFVPEIPSAGPIPNVFETADKLEFRTQNSAQAVQALRLLTEQPVTRAEVLLRIARLERRLKNPEAALAAYDRMSGETAVNPDGVPYTLLAAGARCGLLAGQLRAELIAGRLLLHLRTANCATVSAPSEMFKTLLLEDRMTWPSASRADREYNVILIANAGASQKL